MIRVGSRMLTAQRDAFVAAARGGLIRLCTGKQPKNSDTPPDVGQTLVAFDIDGATFTNDGVDAVVAMAIEEYARAEGRVTHFVVTSALQEPLVDGKVGIKRDGRVLEEGDLYLNRIDLLPGDKVNISEFVIRFRTQ